ncbi:unnamed protein product [Blepharisma stoltei]|uniref:Uncharacterized protein n=1 Tax=Blepharisma stoltei TaxID=1481888 RepID=A0AAU9KB09_9CILI|nr:unnamed protein product [Blepharisma stoltei]
MKILKIIVIEDVECRNAYHCIKENHELYHKFCKRGALYKPNNFQFIQRNLNWLFLLLSINFANTCLDIFSGRIPSL